MTVLRAVEGLDLVVESAGLLQPWIHLISVTGHFPSFVRLSKAHNVNHQSFLLSSAEFNEAIIEGF